MKRILIAFALAVQLFTRANAATMEVFVGSGFQGELNGIGVQTMLNEPREVTVDSLGTVYLLDQKRIRRVSRGGVLTTFSSFNFEPPAFGISLSALTTNLLLFCDGATIQEFSGVTQTAHTFAGGNGTGFRDGPVVDSLFWWPIVAVAGPAIYVSDYGNKRIRIINSGVVSTLAGSGNTGRIDGNGVFSSVEDPNCIAVNSRGEAIIRDYFSIRWIYPDGRISTVVSNTIWGKFQFDPNDNLYAASDTNVARLGSNYQPIATYSVEKVVSDFVIDKDGNLYAADAQARKVFRARVPILPAHIPQTPTLAVEMRAALTLTGETGYSYRIESAASANGPWKTEDTVTLRSSPQAWIDPAAAKGSKLYRAILLQ